MNRILIISGIMILLMTGNAQARMDEPATSAGSSVGADTSETRLSTTKQILEGTTTGSELNCDAGGSKKIVGTEAECRALGGTLIR